MTIERSNRKQLVLEAVTAYLEEHPTAPWNEVWQAVPNHYCDAASMRSSLKDLTEKRIQQAPAGVLTNTASQQAVMRDGRGVSQGSPDAININPDSKYPVGWLRADSMASQLNGSMQVGYDLLSRYLDYELMDDYGEAAAALDVYADDATIVDVQRKHLIWTTSDDQLVRDLGNNLLYRRLDIEADAWSTVRTICKYGNCPAEIIATEEGVVGLNYLPPATMRKVLDHRGIVLGYVQSITGNFLNITAETFKKMLAERTKERGPNKDGLVIFAPWEIVWWQMPSKQVRAPYGVSVYDAARWAWKRLSMLEDSSVVYRLTKSPSRFAVYVDTQNMAPTQATAYLQQVKQMWKKRKIVDPNTGQIDFRQNVMANDEDLFIPVRGGREATRVDVLAGPDYNIIDDLEYFRSKFYAALRTPKSYFGLADEMTRANLSQQDIMFARTVMRIQRMYMTGLMQVLRLHLSLLEIDPDLLNVGLEMTVPSSILEMAQIETNNARAALAQGMTDYYDRKSILMKVFGESAMDAEEIIDRRRKDMRADAEQQGEAQARMAELMQPAAEPADAAMPAAEPPTEPVTAEAFQQAMRQLDALTERVERVRMITERTHADMPRLMKRFVRRG